MEIKHTVSAFLRAFKSKNTLYQIKLRISYKSRSCEVSTGYSLHSLEAWDNENKCVKPKYIASKNASSTTVNKHIAYCVNIAEDVFKFYEVNNIIPSIKEFLEMYSKKSKGNTLSDDHCAVKVKPKEPSFWEVLHRFMEETGKKNDWAPATYVKYKSLENDLQTFNPNLKFANLTETTLTNFVCFLRDTKKVTPPKARADADGKIPGEKIGLNNSTIEKKISYLRWFLNWAVKKGYCKNIEYQDFKPTLKTAEKPIIYLTEDELKKILNYKIPKTKQYLEKTRDVLHFCCVTGLRYSDACNLRRYNIKEDCIELTTIKTTDKLLIPLNEPAKKIIAKYKKTPFPEDRVLPSITNQKMNQYLKELCKLAGIDTPVPYPEVRGSVRTDKAYPKYELISSHVGRKTFVTLGLSKGIDIPTMMKLTGHASPAALKPYMEIVESTKFDAMQKFNNL